MCRIAVIVVAIVRDDFEQLKRVYKSVLEDLKKYMKS
jgi:hypothetical protein